MPTPSFTELVQAASYMVKKGTIDAACFVTSDRQTLGLARNTVLSGKPLAQSMLDHYLEGTGTDVAVKTSDLFQADPSIASHFLKAVKPDMGSGKTEGNVPVSQAVYSNQDWRNALGSINLQWKTVDKGVIETWFINRYRWHPGAARVSQCVHKAAENLKSKGAAEFEMIGSHYRLSP